MVDDHPEGDGRTRRRITSNARLYEAALSLLARKAYHEVSVEDICEEAGLGRATFFRAFGKKTGLLREFNDRLAAIMTQRIADLAPASTAAELHILGETVADVWSEASLGMVAMVADLMRSSLLEEVRGINASVHACVSGTILRGLEEGEFRSALPAPLLTSLAMQQLSATATYWMEHRDLDLHVLMRNAMNSWIRSITT